MGPNQFVSAVFLALNVAAPLCFFLCFAWLLASRCRRDRKYSSEREGVGKRGGEGGLRSLLRFTAVMSSVEVLLLT